MLAHDLTHAGRRLLDRRDFLAHAGFGLAGVALTSLLADQGLLAAEQPPKWSPTFRPEAPLAARPPHFAAKAKRVLMIFCSGALSHVDSFDHKPELIKRHGAQLPGADKLETFQGKHGALTKPLWPFRPRGQCGKMISDLFP